MVVVNFVGTGEISITIKCLLAVPVDFPGMITNDYLNGIKSLRFPKRQVLHSFLCCEFGKKSPTCIRMVQVRLSLLGDKIALVLTDF